MLWRRHEQIIRSVARRLARNDDDADDITQDTRITAFKALASGAFRGESKLSTWLYQIVASKAKDHYRSKHSTEVHIADLRLGDVADSSATPEEEAERAERRRAVKRLVGSLTDKQREIASLIYFEHSSYEEAARLLGIPIGTVKSRLNQALTALAKPMKEMLKQWETQETSTD